MVYDYDVLITNGKIVIPHFGVFFGHIGIKDGKIVALFNGEKLKIFEDDSQAKKTIDVKGLYIFPGFVDPHVHFGNTLEWDDDVKSETIAAAVGGVTTIITNIKAGLFDSGFPSYSKIISNVINVSESSSSVDHSFHFHISRPKYIDEIESYYNDLGIQSFKIHMGYQNRSEVEGVPDVLTKLKKIGSGVDDGIIYRCMKKIGQLKNKPLLTIHAESDDIIRQATEETHATGMKGLRAWNAARPEVAEEQAIARAIIMSKRTMCPIYIVHTSTAKGLDLIREANQKGHDVICETCVHYLSLTEELEGTMGKVAPPLRTNTDVESLWNGIKDGYVRTVGTDHSAKPRETKGDDIWAASNGFPGLDTFVPVMITEGLQRGVSLDRIAEVCSLNTAKIFKLFPKKGTIGIGLDADLVVVDIDNYKTVEPSNLKTVSYFSPWEGQKLRGWPVMTILRGEVIAKEGKMVKKEYGKFIPRYPN